MQNKQVQRLILTALVTALAAPAHGYYGNKSTEATLVFEATADVLWDGDALTPTGVKNLGHFNRLHKGKSRKFSKETWSNLKTPPQSREDLNALNAETEMHDKAIDLVEEQIQHLMGTFQSASFKKQFKHFGVLGEQENYFYNGEMTDNYNIEFLNIVPGTDKGRVGLTYRFTGKSVFEKSVFDNKSQVSIPLKLPLSPDLIYQQSFINAVGKSTTKNGEPFSYCTDSHYNSEGDFWYFWDPEQVTETGKGKNKKTITCGLSGNTEIVQRPVGKLTKIENSKESFPNYAKLFGNNGNKSTLEVSILMGYINDISNPSVVHTKDISYKNFGDVGKMLLNKKLFNGNVLGDGFKLLRENSFRDGQSVIREYEANVRTDDKREMKVHVKMLLTDTGIETDDGTFGEYLVDALENSDVLIYDGHSGLGANLDLEFFDVTLNPDKYQIFFFNGCSSYSYYNGMYFKAKQGTKNLDIVNSGLETSSDSTARNVFSFLKYIVEGKNSSYQTILSLLERSNGKSNGTYLTGVTGEMDRNNKRPSEK